VRPQRVVAVVGTGTDIGKTWVSARLIMRLREGGVTVAARKPAQSFDQDDERVDLDASILGAASGELDEQVCPAHRWYAVAMAPPMAADALGRPPFTIADLMKESESRWPDDATDMGLVETAGGVRSPLASDGDCLDFCVALAPDFVVLVADAGLGTINAVRLTLEAMTPLHAPTVVVLNRFDAGSSLHRRNLEWLRVSCGLTVVTVPGEEMELERIVLG
jgi:dethiobiotin synthetase